MAEIAVIYTLETPRGTLRFNEPDENGDEYRLDQVEGLDHPVIRSAVVNRPQAAGAIVFPSLEGARYPILQGRIRVVATDPTVALERRRELEDKLRSWCGSLRQERGTLRWDPSGAPTRRLNEVQLIDRVHIAGGVVKEFMVAFVCADPTVYSDTEHSLNTEELLPGVGSFGFPFGFPFGLGSESSGGGATVHNGGDEPSWPTVRIHGYVIGPRIRNLTTGYEVALPSLQVAAGMYAEISMRDETVYLNGSTDVNLAGSLDVPASIFWPLVQGDNSVQLTAGGFQAGAYAQILYRHCFG